MGLNEVMTYDDFMYVYFRFRFIKNPEYIKEGARMVFREGRTKAVGNIIKLEKHLVNLLLSCS